MWCGGVIVLCLFVCCESAKILAIFPVPSISHQVVFRKYVDIIAERGHEVVVITTDGRDNKHVNITEIDVHDLSYNYWRENYVKSNKGVKYSPVEFIDRIYTALAKLFVLQMKDARIKEVLEKDEKYFDLIVFESLAKVGVGFSYKFKAPVISFTTFHALPEQSQYIGAPMHSILYPNVVSLQLYNHSLWDKIREVYIDFATRLYLSDRENLENESLKEVFGKDCPTISELNNNIDMLFLNINPTFEGNRPMPPAVVHLGGMHLAPEKPLSLDLKTFLDGSKNGVIYMSLGTNVQPSQLPPHVRDIFLQVFAELPYDVLVKWDKVDFELPKNVRAMKYFQQMDLLKHPKIKLFITQAGLQSADEAIVAHVPMIALPVMGDQFFNADKFEKFGIGIRLDFDSLTKDIFKRSIETVIGDKSYRDNIAKLDALYRDQMTTPAERAIWWTEYVIRNKGAKHLRSPSANISWSEYLVLDVILVFFVALILLISALVLLIKYLCTKLFSRNDIKRKMQ